MRVSYVEGPPRSATERTTDGSPADVVLTLLVAVSLIAAWRQSRGRPRTVVNIRLPGRLPRAFLQGLNTCPDHADGRQTWEQFVGEATAQAADRSGRSSY